LPISLLDNFSKETEILVDTGRSISANTRSFDFNLDLLNPVASIQYNHEVTRDLFKNVTVKASYLVL